ncbi:TonB-dependent receptor [Shewanella sp. JM162201]|uniref:TonB-dependent receptor n=1 Tax=Shewanella jiangmenensis TaxID=2837387 RepID=A0ABS5V5P1_9GAMM|nr:TonB-dependent receptor [Shewanella jiangmenensis]MBT1445175.1 TonB-dependent receptor [Shewanella jiangmenensis]
MKSHVNRVSACLAAMGVAWGAWADAGQSIFDLSLEQLADIEVSVSSKQALPLSLAPANVSVFSQQQLEQRGVNTLAELADLSSGYSSYSIFGERVFETRGQRAGSFENNKHLVLLDGVRLNHARANKAPIENELPLMPMRQVELLRGPASAVYGQSAFFGVVSLSSDSEGADLLRLDASHTLDGQGDRGGVYGRVGSRLGQSFAALSYFDKRSADALVGPDFSPLQRYYDDQEAHFAYLKHGFSGGSLGDFTLGYIDMARSSGLGEHWMGDLSAPENNIRWDTDIGYLRWQRGFGEAFRADVHLVNNDSAEAGLAIDNTRAQILDGEEAQFNRYLVDVNSKLLEAELSWQPGADTSLLFGMSLEKRRDEGGFFVPDLPLQQLLAADTGAIQWQREASDSVEYRAAYLQYSDFYPSIWGLHLTAGLRYDSGAYGDDTFEHFSPRVALVKSLSDRWTAKALYSSAFRSPGLKEYLLNDETRNRILSIAANPEAELVKLSDSLSPETFSSTELDLLYVNSPWMVKLGAFYNQTDNALDGRSLKFIDKNGDEVSKNSFANSAATFEVYGTEAEFEWRFSPVWQLNGAINRVWPASGSEAATQDMPTLKYLLGVSGDLAFGSVRLDYRFHGDIAGDVDAIQVLDASVRGLWHGVGWSVKLGNLLDAENFYAFGGEEGNPLPGRTLEFGLSYRFD